MTDLKMLTMLCHVILLSIVIIQGTLFAENVGINDPNLFEGDIILTPHQRWRADKGLDLNSSGRKRGSSRFSLWPRGVVAYQVERVLGNFPTSNFTICGSSCNYCWCK